MHGQQTIKKTWKLYKRVNIVCTIFFYVYNLWNLPTECIYMFHVIHQMSIIFPESQSTQLKAYRVLTMKCGNWNHILYSVLLSQVLRYNTLCFGNRFGPLLQDCVFRNSHQYIMIISTVVTQVNVKLVNNAYSHKTGNVFITWHWGAFLQPLLEWENNKYYR
jgi:hypothetical protein